MDVLLVIMLLATFSTGSTLAIALSMRLKANQQPKMKILLTSSILLSIGLLLMVFDYREWSFNNRNIVVAFFAYAVLTVAFSLIAISIAELYNVPMKNPILGTAAFAMTFGILGAVATYYDTILYRGVILMLSLAICLIYVMKNVLLKRTKYQKNVYFYQIIFIGLVLIYEVVRVSITKGWSPSYEGGIYDMIGTTLIMITLITLQVSYLSELNFMQLKEIDAQNYDLKQSMRTARRMSETDALTGICNRRKVYDIVERWLDKNVAPFSVIMCDIDRFKTINDEFGHQIGDKVLIHFARVLDDNTRNTDVVGRLGGDEFVLLLEHTSKEKARLVVDKIRDVLSSEVMIELESTISFSMGIASSNETNFIDDLFDLADKRMYQDKKRLDE